jgi:tetratricopeptide (TPR) repeat protein
MRAFVLLQSLLIVSAFGTAAALERWFQGWAGNRTKSANVIAVALGDSRKLFAKHFYIKADSYFHAGYYPTIYDGRSDANLAMATGSSGDHDNHIAEMDFLGRPRDWIDRFSRNFFPSVHKHLDEDCCDHDHKHDEECEHDHKHKEGEAAAPKGLERELLPWLKLASVLDPERPETYVVASFWLRSRLGKVDEAEQFLREGLRANPQSYELLFELGRIYYESRKDNSRARILWQLALKNYRASEEFKNNTDFLTHLQLLAFLGKLEEQESNYAEALKYFEQLKEISPSREQVQSWIDWLKERL